MTDVRAPASAPTAAERTIRRRRSLPGGRAVVGAFLVTVAAVGIFAAYTDAAAGPVTRYVVAARDVAIGTRLTAEDLALVALDLPIEQRNRAFDDPAVLDGATLIGPLSRGDLVQSSLVLAIEPGVEQVSFAIAADRAVGGRLAPGERIDLLATYGSGDGVYTEAIVRDALVVKVDEDPATNLGGFGNAIVTVAVVDAAHSLRIAHAVSAGDVTLVRTTGTTRVGELPTSYRPSGGSP